MKPIYIFAIFSFFISGTSYAEITTKKQADEFMNQYCISLVNEFKKTIEVKNELKKNAEKLGEEDLTTLLLTGAATVKEIDRFVDVYSKVCK